MVEGDGGECQRRSELKENAVEEWRGEKKRLCSAS